jgi:hypothetical protein
LAEDIEKTRKDKSDAEATLVLTEALPIQKTEAVAVTPARVNRLQQILCEPSSCDATTREQIMNEILSGQILELGHRFLHLQQDEPLGEQEMEENRRIQELQQAEQPLVVDGSLFEDDRDRHQAPVMHLDRDV